MGVWDGLGECEISMPEILSQSCLVLHGGCSVTMHSLANCQHTEVSAQTAGLLDNGGE